MLPLQAVFKIIIRNLTNTGYPFPIDSDKCHKWAKELNLPRDKETVLYTSCLYQLVPYINSMVKLLEKAEHSGFWRFGIKMYSNLSLLDKFSGLFIHVSDKDLEPIYRILKSIALLLRKAGVDFGYLYEDDIYSGALLYDLGLDELFKQHAVRVNNILKRHNVRKIITIDPHTHHMFNTVFPKYIDDFNYEVVNYLELLSNTELLKPVSDDKEDYTIHDPCLYARWENIINEPRELLKKAGINLIEPMRSRLNTSCCGGPIESMSPNMSKAVAIGRLNELKEFSSKVITLCPICLANLSRHAKEQGLIIEDISVVLARRFGLLQ